MARIQRHSCDSNPIQDFALNQSDSVSRINHATWIIGESREDLDIVSKPLKLLGKDQSLELRLGIKPLDQHQDAHAYIVSGAFTKDW